MIGTRPSGDWKCLWLSYILLVFKAFGMGGVPENITAGDGEHGDHSLLPDAENHLGSETMNDRDNSFITQHV